MNIAVVDCTSVEIYENFPVYIVITVAVYSSITVHL